MPEPQRPLPRRRRRRAAWIAAGIVALLVAVPFAAKLVALHLVRNTLQRASVALDRAITVRSTDVSVLPALSLDVTGVTVGPARGAVGAFAVPLVRIDHAHVRVGWWELLRASARGLDVDELEIDSPAIEIVRGENDRLSIADVVERIERWKRDANTGRTSPRARVDRFVVRAGSIAWRDALAPEFALHVRQIGATAFDARTDGSTRITVVGAVDAAQPNVHATLDLVGGPPSPRVHHLDVRLDAVDLGAIVHFTHVRSVAGAVATGTIHVDPLPGTRAFHCVESLALRGFSLRTSAAETLRAVDVTLDSDVTARLDVGDFEAHGVRLGIGAMRISGAAEIHGLPDRPRVSRLLLESEGLALERIVDLLPQRMVPSTAQLSGPLVLRASASGTREAADVELLLDLTPATVLVPALDKPAGTPLALEFRGRFTPDSVAITRAGVTLGAIALVLHGSARAADDFALTFDTGDVPLDALLRFLPAVHAAVPPRVRLDGTVAIAGDLTRHVDGIAGHAAMSLRGARATTPRLSLEGNAELIASVRLDPGDVAIDARLDATDASVIVPALVDKRAGVPFRAALRVERSGGIVRVSRASLDVPGASFEASGVADMRTHRADVRAPACAIDVARLATVIPALVHRIPASLRTSHARFALHVDANTRSPGDARVQFDSIEFAAPFGHLRGHFAVDSLRTPRHIELGVTAGALDVDALGGGATVSPGARTSPRTLSLARLDLLSRFDVDLAIHLASLRVRDVAYTPLDLVASLHGGRAAIRTLRVGAYDGTFVADGSEMTLTVPPRFGVHVRAERLDLARFHPAALDDPTRRPEGRLSFVADVTATGGDEATVDRTLTGAFRFTFENLRLRHVESPGHVVIRPTMAGDRLQARERRAGANRPTMIVRTFTAAFRVQNARFHTLEPITADSDAGQLHLTGDIGIDNTLALGGTFRIEPAYLLAITHGQYDAAHPITVPMRLTGTMRDPRFELTDLAGTVVAFAGARIRGIGAGIRRIFVH